MSLGEKRCGGAWSGEAGLAGNNINMTYLAILVTVLFLVSSRWMIVSVIRAYRAEDRPTIIPIVAFLVSAEAMAILWWFV